MPLHLALFPRLWLDVHSATHIDRKHITSLLCCSYTVDYVDAVLLDERASLGVPAIHQFLKTFFPKLASHVLTEQTCTIIDNFVVSLTSMVDAVDIQATAHKLTGDLRALTLVYNSGTRLKAPNNLQAALETLLSRTRSARLKETQQQQQQDEAPSKKRKFNSSGDPGCNSVEKTAEGEEQQQLVNTSQQESQKETLEMDVVDVDEKDDKDEVDQRKIVAGESMEGGNSKAEAKGIIAAKSSSANLVTTTAAAAATTTASSCTSQLRCPLTNVSWLHMLEKTIVELQMVVQMHIKNN